MTNTKKRIQSKLKKGQKVTVNNSNPKFKNRIGVVDSTVEYYKRTYYTIIMEDNKRYHNFLRAELKEHK